MSRSRNPAPRGQGAARAKQMGLLLDLSPDGGMDDDANDEALEAELLNLMGGGGGGGRSQGKKDQGKAPVPMADIERMAALCMKDLDDEEIADEDLDDEDLLAELNDVLEDSEEQTPSPPAVTPAAPKASIPSHSAPLVASSGAGGLESRILQRTEMYKTAISNAKAAGETSKVRRYDRGLKTLQSMLTSVKKGKPVNEDEMPPPVALGGNTNADSESQSDKERELPQSAQMPPPPTNQKPLRVITPTATNTKSLHPTPPQRPLAITPETPAISPLTPNQPNTQYSELKQAVLSRQREYKLAAINNKESGHIDQAKQHYVTAKKLNTLVEALDRGEPVDLSSLPPPPEDIEQHAPPPPQSSSKPAAPPAPAAALHAPAQVASADLPAPSSLAEALQQRMNIYKSAAEGAKSKGDDRKARMHERIVKQYQDAIRAHKAGRPINLSDLPVPPGCPPLQGSEGGQQNLMGVLETAMKIANQDADAEDEEEDGPTEAAKAAVRPPVQKAKSPAPQPPGGSTAPKLGPKAQQQVDFLLLRRQAFLRAALHSKNMKDMSGAAQHLRNAKGLDPMINAAKSGLPVDITKIPSFPVSEDDYSLARSRTSPLSPRSSEQYHGLMDLLKKQHEKCITCSQEFIRMGNMSEALKSEKLVEECMQNIEILKKAHAKGQPVPKCRTEERTIHSVKTYSNLTLNDLMLYIIRGISLPAPSGVSPNDLDASVKFEFPFPSAEEAQRDKTSTVKGTNSPDFKEQFKLNINRNHRGFKRVIQSKGIKFEVIHKGGLFKTDKVVGTAHLKLEGLENHCDIREIIEVMDGRKATGGKLEVRVKLREPVSGADIQPVTEKWLVLEPVLVSPPERQKEKAPSPRSKPRHEESSRSSHPNNSPPQYKLHSFSLLNYDKERLERKIAEYRKNRRDPPSDLIHQYKEVTHRLQWQKAELERGSPALLTEYEHVLQRFTQGLSESVKKYSSQGNREAAKDALGRLKMVEGELESLRRKRTG
ncbi:coiled-coil and C2 domain-containing protein 1A [Betta splendens]|uniref:Coiled-coil and C2 domain-containing protein 1B n=1 Tax=Betta splendens TaxID=158456 RepID=A0A6P7MSG4_BETSP|nr:coiled-coil and C2 domain-containing protein 1A [Betta splendens]